MISDKTTRRRFVVAAVAGSGALASGLGLALVRASNAWAQALPDDSKESARTLTRMARLLFPHASVSDDVYIEIVDEILSASANDSPLTEVLDQAVVALDAARGTDFFVLDGESQLDVMTSLSEQGFFTAIRSQVFNRLYTHPKLWEAIHYPGSSVEFGGYLERGFDDIDWLPGNA